VRSFERDRGAQEDGLRIALVVCLRKAHRQKQHGDQRAHGDDLFQVVKLALLLLHSLCPLSGGSSVKQPFREMQEKITS
jgi:hypothetical protein